MLVVGILIYYYRIDSTLRLSDACFLSGLFFCCVGLFRVVRLLGLFELPAYGFQKLFETVRSAAGHEPESAIGDYADYQQSRTFDASVTEPMLVGALLILLSLAAIPV